MLQTLPYTAARITGGFWADQQRSNRQISLGHGYQMLEQAGNFHNLRLAAGRAEGAYRGRNFYDEDVYKWLEALGWELGNAHDDGLQEMATAVVELIAAAQEPDGYLDSYYQVVEPEHKWEDLDHGHELYCAGHLIQAAIALQRAAGDGTLFAVARRLADHIDATFGPGKREGTCGHPEIEMALVELYRATGEARYLALAQFFVDQRGKGTMRGHGTLGAEYHQDHVPVRQVKEAAGHAVRQMYLATGVTDLYLETGETALFNAMRRLLHDIVGAKLFVTGGVGARFDGESFGEPYELPSDQCYCETCAAIGSFMWNWRLLLASGDGRYADLMEQTLYNGILASRSLDGKHYFYVNPLQIRGGRYVRLSTNPEDGSGAANGRPEWHYVACCPPNVMRLLSSYAHYLATADRSGIQIHHYAQGTIEAALPGGPARVEVRTNYPWEGSIEAVIAETGSSPWSLRLRIPAWCGYYRMEVNGRVVEASAEGEGYIGLERRWQPGDTVTLALEMEPHWLLPNPRVDAVRGCAAIQRGPIIYCLESQDQPAGVELLDVVIDQRGPFETSWQPELLGGIVAVQLQGIVRDNSSWAGQLYLPASTVEDTGQSVSVTAIPYFRWGNRGLMSMRVWLPRM
ncbi:MAG: glycoside hydrolase family 127 protein [Caldilineaceae bacterium]|nr:glycoside hydrolase family 127 protein [Caldilineaceae bacterium]